MRTSLLGRVEERLKENERFALTFFSEYRKAFISPAWELTSVDFRAAVTDGVMAAIEQYKREQDDTARTGRPLSAGENPAGDTGE